MTTIKWRGPEITNPIQSNPFGGGGGGGKGGGGGGGGGGEGEVVVAVFGFGILKTLPGVVNRLDIEIGNQLI